MTSENDKQIQGAGGKDQRPQATLDLKATEIFPGGKRPEASATQSGAFSSGGTAAQGRTQAGPAASDPVLPSSGSAYSPPPNSTPPSSAPPNAGGGGGFLGQLGAGLIGASLALAVGFLLLRTLSVPADRDADGMRRQLAAAQQRIAALESAARTAEGATGGIDSRVKSATDQTSALKQDLAVLGKRIGALETQPPGTAGASAETVQQSLEPVNARIAALDTRLAALIKSQDELRATASSAALAMAVQNLRRAVSDGKPFATELKNVTALASEPLEVAPLEARRDNGLASMTKLQQAFDAPAKAAIAASRTPGDGTFTGGLLASARGLFRVRPTGEVAGDTPEAILARAELRLDAGDLPAALGEAAALSGPAAEAMTPWLTEAKAKAAADETLAKIEAKLMTSLSSDERAKRGG